MVDASRASRTLILAAGLFLLCSASMAQISLLHVSHCGQGAFPATLCTVPATGSGNLVVVGWASSNGGASDVIASITDNAGNTYVEAGPARAVDTVSVNDMGDIWYAKNSIGGATTITITPNPAGAVGTAVVWEFSGVDTTSPLDQTATLSSQPATTTPAGATVTTTSANELVLSVAYVQGIVSGILSGNSFTNDSTAAGDGWAHLITSAVGSYAGQWSSNSGTYGATTVSFRASGSSGGGGVTSAGPCDLNQDGVVNVVDVQLAVNMDLSLIACTAKIDGSGVCNPTVVQRVVNAALGSACVVSHNVLLSWAASTSTIAGYNVYRGTTSGGPYTKLNSSPVAATTYGDSTVQSGQTYYYVTTAVDSNKNESTDSNEAAVVIPTP